MKKLLLSTLVFMSLTACGQNHSPTSGTTYDRSGQAIELPEQVSTLMSLAPSITQVLEDIGATDKIVATDIWSTGFSELPQLDMMNPDLELILTLAPDLILIGFPLDDSVVQMLQGADIAVALIPTSQSIEDIKADNQFIADVVGLSEQGAALNQMMADQIAQIQALAQTVPEPKTVFFEISPAPDLFTFGQGTFLQEMLDLVGAHNIFGSLEGWLPVSDEAVISANPDVILTNVNFLDDPVTEILNRGGWEHVTAIENGAVFQVDADFTSQPNHRIIYGLWEMAVAIYPDIFQQETP